MTTPPRPDDHGPAAVSPAVVEPAVLRWQDAPGRPTRRRWLFWPTVLLALGVAALGGQLAWAAFEDETSPRTVVEQYLAALASGDAQAALAYGDIPDGSRDLLSDAVLQAQLELAPITRASVGDITIQGEGDSAAATVSVAYELTFAEQAEPVPVTDTISLRRDGRTWRLAAVAAQRTINVTSATDRTTLDGETVPDGTYLVFPGALPVGFDTDNLALPDVAKIVRLDDATTVEERPVLSPVGEETIRSALEVALTACLDGTAPTEVLCPLPADPRAVPGSIRGELTGDLADEVVLQLQGNREGRVLISGDVTVTGEYQTLDFNNQRVTRTGELTIDLLAFCYAVTPDLISWRAP